IARPPGRPRRLGQGGQAAQAAMRLELPVLDEQRLAADRQSAVVAHAEVLRMGQQVQVVDVDAQCRDLQPPRRAARVASTPPTATAMTTISTPSAVQARPMAPAAPTTAPPRAQRAA